ncbi:Na+/H+ antiporter subunit G [Alkanindiges sp. WGS2144]|uniref:Na+/H+ antiporter subunit G n=1 Tax=Alkanindiges sp. WGS2144 TaxID=3366808 RepID=UPI00375183BD
MNLFLEGLAIVFLLISSAFLVVGSIGLVRLPDLFMRLHAPTKSSTLGLGGVLLASITLSITFGRFGMAEILITLLAFITAPVSANLMAQAAIHLNLRSQSGEVPEAINRPLPWQRPRENIKNDS